MLRRSHPQTRDPSALFATIPIAFLCLFFAWPVARIVGRGLSGEALLDALGDHRLRQVAWFTLWQAVVSTGLTLAVGLPCAFVIGRYRFRGRTFVSGVLTAPFVLPTVVVGTAFLALLPSSLDRSIWAILAAHVFFNIAVVVRTVGGMWAHVDLRLVEAARTLGASPWQAGRHITLPLLRPAIDSAATLVFLFTFGSFGIVQILGGPSRSTVETEIYRQTAQLLRLDRAAALATFQIVAMGLLLWWSSNAQRRRTVSLRRLSIEQRLPARRVIVLAVLVPVMSMVLIPIAVLVARSLRMQGADGAHTYGLDNYRALADHTSAIGTFGTPLGTIATSLRLGAVAALISVIIGALASFALAGSGVRGARDGPSSNGHTPKLAWRLFDTALLLPLGTSAVTLGFGFLVAFADRPIDWRSRWFAVPVVQALVGLPFVVRAVLPVLRSVDPHLREVAATLGASPLRIRAEIDLPIARRALVFGAAMAFAISLGEFGATTVLVRPESVTVPVAIARLLGRPGTVPAGQAAALAVLLAAMTAGVVMAVERAHGAPGVTGSAS